MTGVNVTFGATASLAVMIRKVSTCFSWFRCLFPQAAGSRSKYNLALSPGLWRSRLYDLRTWEAGLCHTYSPAHTSRADRIDRMAVLLGNFGQIKDFYYFQGFDIYIHEKVKGT